MLSQQALQTGPTKGWARLTTRPTPLALLLLPAPLATSPGDHGSDNDGAAGLRAGAAEPVTPPHRTDPALFSGLHTHVPTSSS